MEGSAKIILKEVFADKNNHALPKKIVDYCEKFSCIRPVTK